ncbi:MAG TPA: hypothetical protein VGR53_05725 [Nitrososphaerales archaeon]|nr:hypothetical protein [Nitrososphaerales archaeon]
MQKSVSSQLAERAQSQNVEFVGYSDLNGKSDGLQVVGQRIGSNQYLYVGHFWSGGVSILDVTNPSEPNVIGFISTPDANTWNIKVQVANNILAVPCELNFFLPTLFGDGKYSPGVAFYDVSDPHSPKKLSFVKSGGWGVHRSWWDGGKYGFFASGIDGVNGASAHGAEGVTRELLTLDMSNPAEPKPVSRFMLKGQLSTDPGSRWKPGDTYYVHEPVISGKRAYVSYWDLGFAILDISDLGNPKAISHVQQYPEKSGGNTHTSLPLPDRHLLVVSDECTANFCHEGPKYVWVFDIKDESNPKAISTLPVPKPPAGSPYKNFCEKGDRFGPHCIHENRNNSMISSDTIYATYCNAGVRIYDIKDPYKPREKGYFIPTDPTRIIDPRPYDREFDIFAGGSKIACTQDVYVDSRGYIYVTDTNAGLYILKEKMGS